MVVHRCCRAEGNCRSLALPNFLLTLVALIEYMRFSPTENRPRGCFSEPRGRKFGCVRDDKVKARRSPEDSLVGSKGPYDLFLLGSVMTQTRLR
jgi:hypothetical protein